MSSHSSRSFTLFVSRHPVRNRTIATICAADHTVHRVLRPLSDRPFKNGNPTGTRNVPCSQWCRSSHLPHFTVIEHLRRILRCNGRAQSWAEPHNGHRTTRVSRIILVIPLHSHSPPTTTFRPLPWSELGNRFLASGAAPQNLDANDTGEPIQCRPAEFQHIPTRLHSASISMLAPRMRDGIASPTTRVAKY